RQDYLEPQLARGGKRFHDCPNLAADLPEIDVLKPRLLASGIQSSKGEELVQEIEQMSRRGPDSLYPLLRALGQRFRNAQFQEFGVADDRRKGRPQVVGNDGEEVCLCLIRPAGF